MKTRRNPWYYSNSLHTQNVTIEDVTCQHCNYVTRTNAWNPKQAFAAHMRKYHRPQWDQAHGKVHVIVEEPDSWEQAA